MTVAALEVAKTYEENVQMIYRCREAEWLKGQYFLLPEQLPKSMYRSTQLKNSSRDKGIFITVINKKLKILIHNNSIMLKRTWEPTFWMKHTYILILVL